MSSSSSSNSSQNLILVRRGTASPLPLPYHSRDSDGDAYTLHNFTPQSDARSIELQMTYPELLLGSYPYFHYNEARDGGKLWPELEFLSEEEFQRRQRGVAVAAEACKEVLSVETREAQLCVAGWSHNMAEALAENDHNPASAARLSPEEAHDLYLEWNGIIGYGNSIRSALSCCQKMLGAAVQP